jgi:hypothetical protein
MRAEFFISLYRVTNHRVTLFRVTLHRVTFCGAIGSVECPHTNDWEVSMKKTISGLAFVLGMLASLSAFAAAVIESVAGDVRAGPSAAASKSVAVGERIAAGSTVLTGNKSVVILRFDDGQAVVLNDNSEFRVAAYSFSKEAPAKDRFSFELLRGAMRSVTAVLTNRNMKAYTLRTTASTIGIRGTDFMVAVENPTYFSVLAGVIEAANAAGAATFSAGATGFAASATAVAAAIPATALPGTVAASFKQLGAVSFGAAGASQAVQSAAGGVGGMGVGVAAALAAALAIAVADDSDDAPVTGTAGFGTGTGTR